LIITDLAPQEANVSWYRMRSWIECSFQDTKRGGFDGYQTTTTDLVHTKRQWLALATARLKCLLTRLLKTYPCELIPIP
jgi:hypothetical protein